MQKLIFTLTLSFLFGVFVLQGQTKFETRLQNALGELSLAHSPDAYNRAAEHFQQLAKENPECWLPLYYAILANSSGAYMLNADQAITVAENLEKKMDRLLTLDPDRSEALTLKGFVKTIKVAAEPMKYGMTLSPEIIQDYKEAITLNPENPRAIYLLGQYKMRSAPYYGKDSQQYCSRLEKAKQLFSKQVDRDLGPSWGEEKVDQLLKTKCTE